MTFRQLVNNCVLVFVTQFWGIIILGEVAGTPLIMRIAGIVGTASALTALLFCAYIDCHMAKHQ